MSIKIGILGYGNLGRGVECAIKHNPDTELVAVFTRRDPETVKILTETAKVYSGIGSSLYEKRSCNSEDPDRGSSSVQSRGCRSMEGQD